MEIKKELQDYIQAYIETWMYVGDVSDRKSSTGSLPHDWEVYVQKGLFTTEKIYLEFLENHGLKLFPDLIRTMATLQEHGRSIHLTDGNPRDVPFPPAFQAAFVKIAERYSVSDDLLKRKYLRNSLRAERDRPHWWSWSGGVVMVMQQKDNAIRSANRTIQELDGKAFGDGLCAERDRPHWWSRSGGVVMGMQQKDNAIRSATCKR